MHVCFAYFDYKDWGENKIVLLNFNGLHKSMTSWLLLRPMHIFLVERVEEKKVSMILCSILKIEFDVVDD